MDKGIYLVPISTVSPVPSTVPVPTAVAGQPIQELALTAAGMTYDKKRQLVYLVTSGSVGQLGNAVVVLDPLTAAVQNYAYVGSNPSQIVMSDSGNAIHVALSGSRSVATLNPLSLSTASTTPLWDSESPTLFPAYFIAAVPGSDTAFVASRSVTPFNVFPPQSPTTVAYDNGAPLPLAISDNVISLAPGNAPGIVYQGNGSIFRKLFVGLTGITIAQQQPNPSGGYPMAMFDNNVSLHEKSDLSLKWFPWTAFGRT